MNQEPSIIGIGNPYRSDDGIGPAIIDRLQCQNFPATLVKASGEGTQLMELWRGRKKVILIDALESKTCPGTIQRFEAHLKPLPAQSFHYSTHAFSLNEAIEMARALKELPETLIVYGIEGKNFDAGEGLSQEVEVAIETVIHQIAEEVL